MEIDINVDIDICRAMFILWFAEFAETNNVINVLVVVRFSRSHTSEEDRTKNSK